MDGRRCCLLLLVWRGEAAAMRALVSLGQADAGH